MLHPYKVRFDETSWAWQIYLPTEECLLIGGVPTSVTADLRPVLGEDGWYYLDYISEFATEIRLNCDSGYGSDSESSSIYFSDTRGAPGNYPSSFSYLIAKVDACRVTGQNITSAIHHVGRQAWVDPGDGETA
jgi:hypothetical protein